MTTRKETTRKEDLIRWCEICGAHLTNTEKFRCRMMDEQDRCATHEGWK